LKEQDRQRLETELSKQLRTGPISLTDLGTYVAGAIDKAWMTTRFAPMQKLR